VVSFFAGMSELHFVKTSILCAISAGVWNALLLLGGYYLGHNWERIGFYLSTYSEAVTAGVIVFLLVIGGRKLYQSRRKNRRA